MLSFACLSRILANTQSSEISETILRELSNVKAVKVYQPDGINLLQLVDWRYLYFAPLTILLLVWLLKAVRGKRLT